MNRKTLTIGLPVLMVFGAALYGAYWYGSHHAVQMAKVANESASATPAAGEDKRDPTDGRRVLYWHDPMVPGQKFDKPGKSPFMDMQLVPVYADAGGDVGTVNISSRVVQNLGVRTAEVTKGSLSQGVQLVGNVAYDERDVVVIQARSGGFVEKLHVRAPLDPVRKGQALVEILSPEWVAAQEEYLTLRRMQTVDAESLRSAARQRMLLLGISEEAIRVVESTGQVQTRATYYAPVGGVVSELGVREGMTVMAGAPLFRINGLARVWINAEVPEAQAYGMRPGQSVKARASAYAGEVFNGRINALLPQVSQATRTLVARIELPNPGGRLAPGMFMTVDLSYAAKKETLLIPSEAIIQTGKRTVVVLALDAGKFQPVDVKMGAEANGQTEITEGLQLGQKVVLSGQFLIDSEASLKGATTRMADVAAAALPVATEHQGEGRIESINPKFVTLSHDPIPSLQWGAMTMEFAMPKSGVPAGLKPGQRVRFTLIVAKDGMPVIARIEAMGDAGKAARTGAKQ